MGLKNAALLLAVGLLTGCWLSQDEWTEKRNQAAINGLPTPTGGPSVPDLGLGACVEELFDRTANGFLTGDSSRLTPDGTCAPASGEERAFAWGVPQADCYVLDATASDMEVAVYGRTDCTGEMVFCGADEPAIVALEEEPILLVVDVLDGATSGEWKVSAQPLISEDLGTNTQYDGDNTGRPTWERFGCPGGPESGAATYLRFTPVSGGTWAFDVVAPFDAVVSLHQACDLETSLDCSDTDVAGHTVARLDLDPLEEVVVRVGSLTTGVSDEPTTGAWSLYITRE